MGCPMGCSPAGVHGEARRTQCALPEVVDPLAAVARFGFLQRLSASSRRHACACNSSSSSAYESYDMISTSSRAWGAGKSILVAVVSFTYAYVPRGAETA